MLQRAWNSKGEMPYCFPRSSIKFQGHTALKIVQFDPNWAFPDCNFSLNSLMAMKCCTELETTKERCPIVFQGHPSNFKVTRDKASLILSQIGHFRTIGRSQLSNPSDLPCFIWINLFSLMHIFVFNKTIQINILTLLEDIFYVFVLRNSLKNVIKRPTVVLPLQCIFKPISPSMTLHCLCCWSPKETWQRRNLFPCAYF